jgi:hypothetical protein
MSTTAPLDAALESARQQGFRIRCEWLGGAGGGACELRGERWLFVDLALDPGEQLEIVLAALSSYAPISEAQRTALARRRAG